MSSCEVRGKYHTTFMQRGSWIYQRSRGSILICFLSLPPLFPLSFFLSLSLEDIDALWALLHCFELQEQICSLFFFYPEFKLSSAGGVMKRKKKKPLTLSHTHTPLKGSVSLIITHLNHLNTPPPNILS